MDLGGKGGIGLSASQQSLCILIIETHKEGDGPNNFFQLNQHQRIVVCQSVWNVRSSATSVSFAASNHL